MPHDKNGILLQVGDTVLIEAKVSHVSPTEDACNVSLNVVGPDEEYKPSITCNSKLVTRVVAMLAALLIGALCSSAIAQDCPDGLCPLRQPTPAIRPVVESIGCRVESRIDRVSHESRPLRSVLVGTVKSVCRRARAITAR